MLKKTLLNLGLIFCSGILLFVIGEASFRAYRFYKDTIRRSQASSQHSSPLSLDKKLGWRSTENYTSEENEKDAAGVKHSVRYETGNYGFRVFGDPTSKKTKVFFIGDSFTQGRQVSNDETYYEVLQKELPIEVFAYGGSGYGTLQEYMILDEYIDLIKPNVIIWQYCSNDFINNSFALEMSSRVNNNGMRRPYMTEEGEVVYLTPKMFSNLRYVANEYSYFLYFLLSRFDKLAARLSQENGSIPLEGKTVETEIHAQGQEHAGFQSSARTTNEIMKMVRKRSGDTKIVTFSADDESPYYEEFQHISQKNGIEFIDGVPQAVHAAEEKGLTVRAADNAHWNDLGHRLVAEKIEEHLRTHGVIIHGN